MISVIVPIYNVEKYLHQCIESILHQTYSDFELILIDDGSKDCSGKICDDYAKLDGRVKVIHQENQGVSTARNVGIDASKGKYIVFCDGDDEVADDYLESLMKYDESVDLVVMGYWKIDEQGNKCKRTVPRSFETQSVKTEHIASMFEDSSINFVWGKRFKRHMLIDSDIRFNEKIDLGEDTIFVLLYISVCCTAVAVTDFTLYHYRRYHRQSLSIISGTDYHRLLDLNETIWKYLTKYLPDVRNSVGWRDRIYSVFYCVINTVLKDQALNIYRKTRSLRNIMSHHLYPSGKRKAFEMAAGDGWLFRVALWIRSPLLLITVCYLSKKKRMFRSKLGRCNE